MLLVIIIEEASHPSHDPPMPGPWDLSHFDDSSRQFVEPTLYKVGLDEGLQGHTATVIGRANPNLTSRARGGSHDGAPDRFAKSSIHFIEPTEDSPAAPTRRRAG